ncbi:MAG: hypothetical protein JW901_05415 [Dehalococcoidia bacterium]|nr:hypothetical protein [Dehalococcoidia bacterium]
MFKHWPDLKSQYIEGIQDKTGRHYPTYAELAEKWKVDPAVIGRRAAKEKWPEARKMFSHKVETLRVEKKSEIMASESAQFDSECLKVSQKGINLVVKAMGQKKKSIPGLALALANFQKVGKLAFGENPEPDKPVTINVKYDKE